ncbi:hypothetical protein DYBT9275_03133 [Dyadobacter sp. CECT 9275]|uniref:Signal transduction histidine kinase internal region domain-containing protein n=1 Tax=Dyadobacter helix TaxID=2822344 RepID=A0A916JFJ2_9BACT|nr:histidine kinase [Dyadobacter sp. CECT 9275]CAG5003352.1 hypothetical protein DYBT9275_03133 [Dyadobacter sp. CECT 9275]
MTAFTPNNFDGHWFFRYKLYHIPFWCAYQYLWWVIAIGNPVKAAESILLTAFSVKFLFYLAFQILAVCFNLYYLIPRYLEKGRFWQYGVFLALTVIAASWLIVPGYYLVSAVAGKTMDQLYGSTNCFYFFISNAFPSTLASMTLAMSIKLTKNWIQTQRRQVLLEKENLETELKFLKYQFNPHFLFNTINSIFFLIHKNPDMASASLAKFSEILRHQLYESNDQQIPLDKEIAYLENFIELEKLRQNKNVEVVFNAPDNGAHLGIAPFILMNFVENAFKHVSKHTDKPNWIKMAIRLNDTDLDFSIANSASATAHHEVISYGGIGIRNVQRRLDLVYPGRYELNIQSYPERFEVDLHLNLSKLEAPQFLEKISGNNKARIPC